MVYFYCMEFVFHSHNLFGDINGRISGATTCKKIKKLDEYQSLYEQLTQAIFSERISKKYPSAHLEDCEFFMLSLNPL